MTQDQSAFITELAGYVQKYAPKYQIMVCSSIIAQGILESGWGKSKLASKYKNYFGLKCGTKWTGRSVNMTTSEEYTPGTHTVIKDNFCVYDSMEEGVKGYFEFIQLERYHNLRGITDPEKYLKTIKADGYATSSAYVNDLMEVIKTYELTKYDVKGDGIMGSFKSVDDAIDAVIASAEAEEGYLEKKSNSQLDSKTANTGKANFTKYWRDIKPAWQGESWCACFISWVFMVVFGQKVAAELLKHWPFLYCPTLAAKTSNKTPKRGALMLFWRDKKKRYGHVALVYKVDKIYVYTFEGNTSGASGVIDNGGGVCRKKYKRSSLDSRTKYFMPDYSIVVDKAVKTPIDNTKSLIPGECTVTLKQFLVGAEHPQIRIIQRELNARGYKGEDGKTLTVDGKLGDNTAYALAAFQEKEKLGIKNPGTVGPKTWNALLTLA